MDLAQGLAVAIFLAMFLAIVFAKVHRFIPALIGAALVVAVVFLAVMRSPQSALDVLNFRQLAQTEFWLPAGRHIESQGLNWQTIIFIAGMMVMVEGLGASGFFRWLCLWVARAVKCRIMPILVCFMIISGFLSSFVDSITVLLFLSSVTVELGRLLKFDPVPMIIAEAFAANTGGSATMSGDPPNIIIGTSLGYTFMDFVVNTGPLALVGMAIAIIYFYIACRPRLASSQAQATHMFNNAADDLDPAKAITSRYLLAAGVSVFILTIALLVTHAQTGLSVALVGVIAAAATVAAAPRSALHVIRKVDWRTLLFFMGLFVCVGGLEETGVLKMLASLIGDISGASYSVLIAIVLWLSAITSAVVDNIPLAATLVPVIKDLAQGSSALGPLSWTLALGTDIGGSATPIGASANVVGTAIAEREGYPVKWGTFMKLALPATIIVLAAFHVLLLVRYQI